MALFKLSPRFGAFQAQAVGHTGFCIDMMVVNKVLKWQVNRLFKKAFYKDFSKWNIIQLQFKSKAEILIV